MRHLTLLVTAALLASCQVAPQAGPAPRAPQLRPVEGGVSVTGGIALPRRALLGKQLPPQQRTASEVASVEAYVQIVPPNSGYRLLDTVPGCNDADTPANATLWTAATLSGGTPPTTLTLTGLPKDAELAVTLVAKDGQGTVISCHAASTTYFYTTAPYLQGNAVSPAPTFHLKLADTGMVYNDNRRAGLQATPGAFLAPSLAPVAVRPTAVPLPLSLTTLNNFNSPYGYTRLALTAAGDVVTTGTYINTAVVRQPLTAGTYANQTFVGSYSEVPPAYGTDLQVGTHASNPVVWTMLPFSYSGGLALYRTALPALDATADVHADSDVAGRAMVLYNDEVYVAAEDLNFATTLKKLDCTTGCGLVNPTGPTEPVALPGKVRDAVVVGNQVYFVTATGLLHRWEFGSTATASTLVFDGADGPYTFTAVAYDPARNRLVLADGPYDAGTGKGTNSLYTLDLAQPEPQPLQLWAGPGVASPTNGLTEVEDYTKARSLTEARFARVLALAVQADGSLVLLDEDFENSSAPAKVRRIGAPL